MPATGASTPGTPRQLPDTIPAACTPEGVSGTRRGRYPLGLWVFCLSALLVVVLLRLATTGRVWGAPWDFLPSKGAMGPGAVLLNWLVGAFVVGAGWHTFHLAAAANSNRRQLTVAGVALVGIGVLLFMSTRSVFSRHFATDVARSSTPVIAALESYKQDHGIYPASLADLVPKYLKAVPSMGYGSRRELHYYRAATPSRSPSAKVDHNWEHWVGATPYALVVDRVPGGTMVFRISGKYDDLPGGRRLRGSGWGATHVD